MGRTTSAFMETFQASEIVSIGDFSPESRDVLSVLWAITSGCNYRCSYCPPGNKAKLGRFSSREDLLRAAQLFLSLNRPGYQITIYGGEPSFHPHVHDLLRFLVESSAPISLRMFTNGSRSADFVRKTVEIAKGGTKLGVIFSLHLEYAKLERFMYAVEATAGGGMPVAVNFMFLPAARERAREFRDALLALRTRQPFITIVSPPYDPAGNKGVGRTPEDVEWCQATQAAFDSFPYPEHLPSPSFTRIDCSITLERHGRREALPAAESRQLLTKQRCPSFERFSCCGGTNVIYVEENGTVRGGVCSSARPMGNAFRDKPKTLVENMGVVVCDMASCSSVENMPLPKFRHLRDAEACVAAFKKRASAYVRRGRWRRRWSRLWSRPG